VIRGSSRKNLIDDRFQISGYAVNNRQIEGYLFIVFAVLERNRSALDPVVFGTDIAKSSSALTLSKRIVI
jgi:hypothetical protein